MPVVDSLVTRVRAGRNPTDEPDFLARLRRRDEAAYRELYRRHHGPLVGLAQSILRDRAAAEEVVQDAWLALVTRLDQFEGRATLSTWLTGIVINKARTRASRAGRERPFDDRAAGDGPALDPREFLADGHWAVPVALWDEIDPERILAGRQLWRHVARELEALPPAQQAVVILRDVEGHDIREICRLLDLSEANCRVLLHRARTRLRALVDRLMRPAEPHASVTGAACPHP